MNNAFWQRLDRAARHVAPFVITVMLVVLNAIPLPVPDYRSIVPLIPLMAIYYWALYRPDLMPPLAAFGLGFIQDALSGTPLGVGSLAFLILHGVAVSQRKAFVGKPFLLVWFGLAVATLIAGVASWALASVILGGFIPPDRPLFQALATIALFPCFAWVLVRVHRGVVH